jgi:hypothetical protein
MIAITTPRMPKTPPPTPAPMPALAPVLNPDFLRDEPLLELLLLE